MAFTLVVYKKEMWSMLMQTGDLVYMNYKSKRKYYLVKDSGAGGKYYTLIDTKTGDITTAYDYKVYLVCAS